LWIAARLVGHTANVPSHRFVWLLPPLLGLACTVDTEDGATSLADPTYAGTTVSTTASSTTASSTTASSTTASSMGDGGSSSEGDPSATGSDGTGSSGGVDPSTTGADGQPTDGAYSACEDVTDCFGLVYCAVPQAGLGFCTDACEIPGDCAPSPGGTAQPACVTATVNAAEHQVCALDCSGGKTCPGGMECVMLDSSMVCA
jgi:hypothetical protein